MMLEDVKQQIAAQQKQLERLQEDLDKHLSRDCGCQKFSWFRCEGHRRATLSVIKNVHIIIEDLERSKERLESKSVVGGATCTTDSNSMVKTKEVSKKAKRTKQK